MTFHNLTPFLYCYFYYNMFSEFFYIMYDTIYQLKQKIYVNKKKTADIISSLGGDTQI